MWFHCVGVYLSYGAYKEQVSPTRLQLSPAAASKLKLEASFYYLGSSWPISGSAPDVIDSSKDKSSHVLQWIIFEV
jgi:hypothetical protein